MVGCEGEHHPPNQTRRSWTDAHRANQQFTTALCGIFRLDRMDRMFNEMIMKSPQRREKRKKKNKLGRPQRTVRKTKAADTTKWWKEWATNQNRHHRASGQLQTTGAHTKSVDAWECLDNKKHFRKRSPHKKKSHGRSTQVSLCHLFGHVCDVCWSM